MAVYPEVIVGTYEEFLLGYEIIKNNEEKLTFSVTIASHAHQGSIRCVDSHKHLLASSGADEYVNIFSLVNKKEVAILTPHSGTVTSLCFVPDGTHLISGSQDGCIGIVRCSDWKMMKFWKQAHKHANGVLGLSVHPSGKLLLSIGADNILRVWNLIKGRQAYAVNFNKKTSPGNALNLVTWSKDGQYYAVCIGQLVEIYSTETAAVSYSIQASSRISCIEFATEVIVLGRDDGIIEIHDVVEKKQVLEATGHVKRVKCAKYFISGDERTFLITADSQGSIKLWEQQSKKKISLELLAETSADCRVVCLTLVNPNSFVKKEDEEVEDNSVAVTNILPKTTKVNNKGEKVAKKKKVSINGNAQISKESVNESVVITNEIPMETVSLTQKKKKKKNKKLASKEINSKASLNNSVIITDELPNGSTDVSAAKQNKKSKNKIKSAERVSNVVEAVKKIVTNTPANLKKQSKKRISEVNDFVLHGITPKKAKCKTDVEQVVNSNNESVKKLGNDVKEQTPKKKPLPDIPESKRKSVGKPFVETNIDSSKKRKSLAKESRSHPKFKGRKSSSNWHVGEA